MDILCIGDVAIATEKDLSQPEWNKPGSTILGEETRILLNWELPVGTNINHTPRSSGSRLLAHPDSPRLIQNWAPGYATLATNHILDAGEEGLYKTIESLRRVGFETVGAGRNKDEIEAPLIWKSDQGRLAILNWVFLETHPDWMSLPGPNCWPGIEQAAKTIYQLKHEVDWVLTVIHWSDECFSYPRFEDRVIAHELAKIGVDLVIGHHPHVVRGNETIGTCRIFYSIGNFYFSDIPDNHGGWRTRQAPRNREGIGVKVSFRSDRQLECQVLPFWQMGNRVILDPLHRATRRLTAVSKPLQNLKESEYAKWYSAKRVCFDRLDYRLHFGLWKLGIRGIFRYLQRLYVSCKPDNT